MHAQLDVMKQASAAMSASIKEMQLASGEVQRINDNYLEQLVSLTSADGGANNGREFNSPTDETPLHIHNPKPQPTLEPMPGTGDGTTRPMVLTTPVVPTDSSYDAGVAHDATKNLWPWHQPLQSQ